AQQLRQLRDVRRDPPRPSAWPLQITRFRPVIVSCLSSPGEGAPMNVSKPTVKGWGNALSIVVGVIVSAILNRKRQSNLISRIRRRYRRAVYVKKLLPIGAIWP